MIAARLEHDVKIKQNTAVGASAPLGFALKQHIAFNHDVSILFKSNLYFSCK
jgi:hypothetical protein